MERKRRTVDAETMAALGNRPRSRPAWQGPNYRAYRSVNLPERSQDAATAAPVPTQLAVQPVVMDGGDKAITMEQGKPQDAAQALLLKFLAVLALEGIGLAALLFLAWLNSVGNGATLSGGWVVGTAICGLFTYGWMVRNANQHSAAGIQRQRNDLTADVAMHAVETQTDAWQAVELERWRLHYGAIERQSERDHEERLRLLDEQRHGLIEG